MIFKSQEVIIGIISQNYKKWDWDLFFLFLDVGIDFYKLVVLVYKTSDLFAYTNRGDGMSNKIVKRKIESKNCATNFCGVISAPKNSKNEMYESNWLVS